MDDIVAILEGLMEELTTLTNNFVKVERGDKGEGLEAVDHGREKR